MNLQKNAYLAIGYACNEKCRCCPLVNKDSRTLVIPFEKIKDEANIMRSLGVTDVTISGGEPTIHPDFFNILEEFVSKNITIHVLSNGEKFADKAFADRFINIASKGQICVTTTFHSHRAKEHEYQNKSKGSFKRSLDGLQYLDSKGINIAVKHCITNNNYRQLPQFTEWVLQNFSQNAEIQFWGIDLCGIDDELARESFVEYKKTGEHISVALDLFEKSPLSHRRVLTINNLPLCMCDAYYWRYFSPPEADDYIEHMQNGRKMDAISGPASKNCSFCKFRRYCQGVYYSNFDVFGDDIVFPPKEESKIAEHIPNAMSYTDDTISKTFLSPYTKVQLIPFGLLLCNSITEAEAVIRAKTKDMADMLKAFDEGIIEEDLIVMMESFGLNGSETVNELIIKGIIE